MPHVRQPFTGRGHRLARLNSARSAQTHMHGRLQAIVYIAPGYNCIHMHSGRCTIVQVCAQMSSKPHGSADVATSLPSAICTRTWRYSRRDTQFVRQRYRGRRTRTYTSRLLPRYRMSFCLQSSRTINWYGTCVTLAKFCYHS